MTIGQNSHSWPDRGLAWSDDLQRKIHLFLDGETAITYTLSIVAWQDRPDGRYWKRETIAKAVPISAIRAKLFELLERARSTADSWAPGDLRHVNP